MCNSLLFVPTYRQTFELSIFFSRSQQEIATVCNTLFKFVFFLGMILFLFLCMKKKEWKTWLNLQQNGELVFSFSLCSHLSCSLLYRVMHLLCSVRSQWIFRAIIIFSHFTCVCVYMCCMSAQTGRQFRRQSCVCCLSPSFIGYVHNECT